jgi:hypothetical protein
VTEYTEDKQCIKLVSLQATQPYWALPHTSEGADAKVQNFYREK